MNPKVTKPVEFVKEGVDEWGRGISTLVLILPFLKVSTVSIFPWRDFRGEPGGTYSRHHRCLSVSVEDGKGFVCFIKPLFSRGENTGWV